MSDKLFDYIVQLQARREMLYWALNHLRKTKIARKELKVFNTEIMKIDDSISYMMRLQNG